MNNGRDKIYLIGTCSDPRIGHVMFREPAVPSAVDHIPYTRSDIHEKTVHERDDLLARMRLILEADAVCDPNEMAALASQAIADWDRGKE